MKPEILLIATKAFVETLNVAIVTDFLNENKESLDLESMTRIIELIDGRFNNITDKLDLEIKDIKNDIKIELDKVNLIKELEK